ncbi:MAG: SH3 domain-containing protein [Anaerolineaceae bacterium]|nr:SH3 domain-containing protein [Anaerolineaceae bacterium]
MSGAATKNLTLTLALLLATGLLPALMTGAQDEPLFHVIPNNNLNLRACGSRDCAVVDRIQAGIRLPVYVVEGDWYQVRSKGRFLWLAGWLTTRVTATPAVRQTKTPQPTITPSSKPEADAFIQTGEIYWDPKTDCEIGVFVDDESDDSELVVALAGDRRPDVEFRVYGPNDWSPLQYDSQFEIGRRIRRVFQGSSVRRVDLSTVIYVVHFFPKKMIWPNRWYGVEIEVDGESIRLDWQKDQRGYHAVIVFCENDEATRDAVNSYPYLGYQFERVRKAQQFAQTRERFLNWLAQQQ